MRWGDGPPPARVRRHSGSGGGVGAQRRRALRGRKYREDGAARRAEAGEVCRPWFWRASGRRIRRSNEKIYMYIVIGAWRLHGFMNIYRAWARAG